MKDSKLVGLLSTLQKKEQVRLLKFLASPYHNVDLRLWSLANALFSPAGSMEKQDVWKAIFPDRPFEDLFLRRLASELLELVVKFLTLEQFAESQAQQQVELLKTLREREVPALYEFFYRKAMRSELSHTDPSNPALDRNQLLNSRALLDDYLLEAERNAWLERSANRSGVTNLDASVASLDRFYLFNKLKYACTRLNNRNVMGGDFQDPLIEGLLKQLPTSHYAEDPAVLIYFRIYQMLSRPEENEHYPLLRKQLSQFALEFTLDEARHLYAFAMNYCIGRINAGEGTYLREIFDLYKESLERKVLLEGDSLSPWDYKNIVVVGLRLSEFEWVESFIRSYKDRIPVEHRENAFTYNLAKLHFYEKHYSEVLKLLQKLEYEDVFYNLDAKVMLLKIYFELHEIDALDSLIESFRTFLRRNKLISASHRTNYLNLILFVKKLSRVGYGDHKRIAKIRADFEATRQIADADWLREKLGG
ncbi:MAG: hypothetical protein IPN95_20290 [Bacteroidetes bacterium]|nr:hypothetical protein [Bacteroidota bacterium]MBP6640712.1 hypothetical protein [Bacteroidia bacterium]